MALIQTETKGSVLEIIFSRPEKNNAMTLEFFSEFEAVLESAKASTIRAVLVHGIGKSFCVGGDIGVFSQVIQSGQIIPESAPDSLHRCIQLMRELDKPIIASVHGACAGAGVSVMLACDLVMAAESCRFNLAYVGIGLSPDGGSTFFLPRHVGLKLAAEIFMSGRLFAAQEAPAWGLINRVCSDQSVLDEARQMAELLAQGPTQAFAKLKKLLNQSLQNSLSDQLKQESKYFSQSSGTEDFKAGATAFLKKEIPQFHGK